MRSPKVSIVIPVYNREAYLAQTVESILAQTYTNWELILVDDGSTDDVKFLYDYYVKKDKRIKVIYKENTGISNSRNVGNKEAKGEYIKVFDSDDVMESNCLEECVKAIKGYDFVYSYHYVGNQQAVIDHISAPPKKITFDHIKQNASWPHFTIMAKRKCFEENPYRDDFKVNDDGWLVWKWFLAGYKYKLIEKPLEILRWHQNNTSRTREKEIAATQKILNKEYEKYEAKKD